MFLLVRSSRQKYVDESVIQINSTYLTEVRYGDIKCILTVTSEQSEGEIFLNSHINVKIFCLQVEKVAQTYETVNTRHCTMIVGPSGGGKTVVIQTLARAQTSLGLTTKLFVLNPKVRACSHSRTHLLFVFLLVYRKLLMIFRNVSLNYHRSLRVCIHSGFYVTVSV
jgi:Type IV secretory pathway, VirB4 components